MATSMNQTEVREEAIFVLSQLITGNGLRQALALGIMSVILVLKMVSGIFIHRMEQGKYAAIAEVGNAMMLRMALDVQLTILQTSR